MKKLKQMSQNFTQVSPFILSNTLIIIPYFIFLGLTTINDWHSIIPFVLFYTFRMTGIFLIRGIPRSIDSFTLLISSLLLGGIGTIVGVLGRSYFPLYDLSAICLGLSASWLIPAKTTVDYHERSQGFQTMTTKGYLYALIPLGILFYATTLPDTYRIGVTLGIYTLIFVLAYYTVRRYPSYDLDFKDVPGQLLLKRELGAFIVFFILLFLLRSSRLLLNSEEFDFALVLFTLLFVVVAAYMGRSVKQWKLPRWLNLFGFYTGMIGNFLFLFGTLYAGSVFGYSKLAVTLYLPYGVGLILAMFLFKKIKDQLQNEAIFSFLTISFVVGLSLLLVPQLFSIGIFIISFAKSCSSSWLNQVYYELPVIPKDQRILAKTSTQNKGSIVFQFSLMVGLLYLAEKYNVSTMFLLQVTVKKASGEMATLIMEVAKYASVLVLLIGILSVIFIKRKEAKYENIH
ncbi:MAG: hypothetical protein ACK5NA_05935 [Enterococcus sp.]